MANIRATQAIAEQITNRSASVRVSQAVIEYIATIGIVCGNPPPGQVGQPYSHTFPMGSGTAPFVFTVSATAPPGLVMNGATGELHGSPTAAGSYSFTVTVTDSLGGTASVTCSIDVSGTVPSPIGGTPFAMRSKGGCSKYTEYDWCLLREMQRWRHIRFQDLCVIPAEWRNLLPWDDTFGSIPEQSVAFAKRGGIVTPTTASGDNVVVSWRMPVGWDGLLTGTYFGYSGSGFAQGSGDIVTRLKINQRYVKDLSNNPFLLGTPKEPLPMTEGQILLSGMLVQSIVNVPNLSGLIVVGASTIYAGQLGFMWPRG